VVASAHHDDTYNDVGKLIKTQKLELVYEPRFAKRTR
jgi:hypothetical protein